MRHARLVPHGVNNGTRDPKVVENWFAAEPGADVAIACRLDYGLFVVDRAVNCHANGDVAIDMLKDTNQSAAAPLPPSRAPLRLSR